MKPLTKITDKILRERLAILKADKDFAKLRGLLPTKLIGKELGIDFSGMTSDLEVWQRNKENNVLLLSELEMKQWDRFSDRCEKLADEHRLHWATVMDLAMRVKHPAVPPRLSRVITGGLDPICLRPRDLDPHVRYSPQLTISPGLEAVEIMGLVHGLDEDTKEQVKAKLRILASYKPGNRILELVKTQDSSNVLETEIEIDVWIRIPAGYTVREVSDFYHKLDSRRREILAAMRASTPRRRRESKALQRDAKKLKLLDKHKKVGIYDIIDDLNYDLGDDQKRRKSIANKRHRERELLKKRYPGWRSSKSDKPSGSPEAGSP